MNRLSPLIDRRPPFAAALTRTAPMPSRLMSDDGPGWLRDAKLFGASYLAGVVVFGTLIA